MAPADQPARIDFRRDPLQVRRDALEVLVTLDEVTAVTAELLEEILAARDRAGPVEPGDVAMARDAAGLYVVVAEQRMEPERDVAVGLLWGVDGDALAVVAGGAAELLDGMLGEEHVAVGMGRERLCEVLETRFVDPDVARCAAVDAIDGLIEVVDVEIGEHDLLDHRDALEADRSDLALHAIDLVSDPLPLLGEPGALLLDLLLRGLDLVDLGLNAGDRFLW